MNQYKEHIVKVIEKAENKTLKEALINFYKTNDYFKGVVLRQKLKEYGLKRVPRLEVYSKKPTESKIFKTAIQELTKQRAIKENRIITFTEVEKDILKEVIK